VIPPTTLVMYHALWGYYWRDRDLWPRHLVTPYTKSASHERPVRMVAGTWAQHYEASSSMFKAGVDTWLGEENLRYEVFWWDYRVEYPQRVAAFK
jgi:hypothetical protein